MIKINKITFANFVVVIVLLGLSIVSNSVQAAIKINDFNVNGSSVVNTTPGTILNYFWSISATKQEIESDCGSNLSWSITRNDQVPPDRRVVKSGQISVDKFLISTTQTDRGTFSFGPMSGQTSEPLKLVVGCGREAGQNLILRPLTRSAVVTINFTGQTQGRLSVRFDANPKSVTPNTNVPFDFKLSLIAKQSDLDCRGGASAPVIWGVYMFPAGSPDNFSSSNLVQEGAVTVSSFGSNETIKVDFPKAIKTLDRDFVFKARVTCDRLLDDVLTTSSAIPVKSGGAGGGGGTCNNNGVCDSGETAAQCPLDKCPTTPGTSQTFKFKLDNPLGDTSNIIDLIGVIATWLFNIAIPIAVAMIVYSGILFLWSQGEPAKVKKAGEILLYTVVGLAIILIGRGFITLIESILKLGSS